MCSYPEYALEIVREKIFRRLNQEVPYEVGLKMLGWDNVSADFLKVCVEIRVKNVNIKKMIIGCDGEAITFIRSNAIMDLQRFFNKKVFLSFDIVAH